MADWRWRVKRTGYGSTLKNPNGFAFKNAADGPITVGTAPVTPNTGVAIVGVKKTQARIVQ